MDFSAAILFLIGSIMFFYEAWVYAGTWMFTIGSVFFALRPMIKPLRELRLYKAGRDKVLAARLK